MSRRTGRLLSATLAAGLVLSLGSAALAAPPIGALKQFKVPTARSEPLAIANGSDGNRWFTESDSNVNFSKIARITPAGAVTEFDVTAAAGCNSCGVHDIAQGPGNILYLTSNGSNLIRFNVSTLTFESPVVIAETGSFNNLAVGAGNVWITDFNSNVVWRYNIATGAIASFGAQTPIDVAVDAAGNAWFTENSTHDDGTTNIGRIARDATPGPGAVTYTPIPAPATAITVAPNGNVWFAEGFAHAVGFFNPADTNNQTVFPVSGSPLGIAAAPNGTIWFTQNDVGNIASITEAGLITETKVVKGNDPTGIVVAPNGDPWFTMRFANKIGAFQLR